MYALNTAYHRAIGDSPHFLMFLTDPRFPFETFSKPDTTVAVSDMQEYKRVMSNINKRVWEVTSRFLVKAQAENQDDYNRRHKAVDVTIQVGARVYVKRLQPRKHKLQTRFLGPYRVIKVNESSVELSSIRNQKKIFVHKDFVSVVPESSLTSADNPNVGAPFPGEEEESSELVMSV